MLPHLLGCAALATSVVAQLSGNVVTLDYGKFTGEQNDGTKTISFRGIRYADAPVGNLRWRAPVSPPSKNLGNVDATSFPAACLQTTTEVAEEDIVFKYTSDAMDGYSEDCLFLNVYVPTGTKANSSLPVLLFIHGGGFQVGDPDGDPGDYLLQSSTTPLIFVTIQYRLGSYGYLGGKALGSKGAFNVGLLDQKAAFRWVKAYIKNFGGDPSRVTIWGQSAGASAVMFHLLAQGGNNEGLFSAAIADSPPIGLQADCTGSFSETLLAQIANEVDCNNAQDLMGCLRAVAADDLSWATSTVLKQHPTMLYPFQPCIDYGYLTSRIVPALESNAIAHVPLLFGSNTNEGAGWSSGVPAPWANTSKPNATEDTAYYFLQGQYPGLTRDSFNHAVQLYPLRSYGTVDRQAQQMYGEMRYICSAVLAGERIPGTYQYHYDNPDDGGSNHGAELAAFFYPPDGSTIWPTMRQYWTSFATSHQPKANGAAAWTNSPNTRILLHPGRIAMENVDNNLKQRCDFWHDISGELVT
ncbi:alpha/beta-hydrolase [Schizophyllum commune Loenen D]|nr:alpha/beta-hydrolase [Schizophyllum commune Loenen D]